MTKRFSFAAGATLVLSVLAAVLPHHNANASAATSRIRQINSQITHLLVRDIPNGTKTGEHRRIAAMAAERFDLLADLSKEDAAAAKQAELPKHILGLVPPYLDNLFEKDVDVEGELQVVAECEETNGRTLYFVDTGAELLQLNLVGWDGEELKTGSRVSVKGTRVGDQVVAAHDSITITRTVNEAASATTLGEKRVLVLLVNFQDNPQSQPYTISQANNLMFNRSNAASVTNYYFEASYGQTWITGDTVGWLTLPMTSGQCDATTTIANYARQAATNAGINVSAYTNYMYVFPNMGCSWAGWGEIGGKNTWIDGSLVLRTTAHELGHNFGLYHSRGINCGPGVVGSSCTTSEYGHIADMIGSPGITGNFNPYQKERLGWLNSGSSASVTTVQGSGTYTIGGLSVQDAGSKALKILKSTDSSGRRTWYYVEFRRPVGFDSFVANDPNTMNGVLVTMNQESNGAENYLLDMVPGTADWSDSALLVGSSFVDSARGLTITPLSVSESGAVVSVSLGNTTCSLAVPTITADPSSIQWVSPGTSASYVVQVTNNNSSSCQSNSFHLSASVPFGWTWSADATSIVLTPGGSVAVTAYVTPPTGAAGGTYDTAFIVSNSANPQHSSNVNRSIGIPQPLVVTVSTSQATYSANQTMIASAIVSTNGTPRPGVMVRFSITRPSGKTLTYSATTSSTGTASISHRINKKQDPPGTYVVQADAEASGYSGTATTTFSVR